MLTTGNQLRAARALADIDQGSLAKRAGVNINTISSMEKRGANILTSGLDKIRAIMNVLEEEGIEFLNDGKPGVRLVKTKAVQLSDTRDQAWNNGRDAYKLDPIHGHKTNPYDSSDPNHDLWIDGYTEESAKGVD
jgi:transcriptional regulator with XRE-family HTH domain